MLKQQQVTQKNIIRKIISIKKNGILRDCEKGTQLLLSPYFKARLTPNNICLLGTVKGLPYVSNEHEILWSSYACVKYKNIIEAFISLKSEYSKSLLSGNIIHAIEILDKILEKCGWSLWLIEAKFYCNQRTANLEGNKNFLSYIYEKRNAKNFDWVYYLSFLISERNEDGTELSRFRRKIFSTINKVDDLAFREKVANIVRFNILNHFYDSDDFIKDILSFSNELSVIDTYETLVRILSDKLSSDNELKTLLPLRILSSISDYRLKNMIIGRATSFIENSTIETTSSLTLNDIDLINISLKLDIDVTSDDQFTTEIITHLSNISKTNENFEDSLFFLEKVMSNIKHINEIYRIINIPSSYIAYMDSVYIKKLASFYSDNNVAYDISTENLPSLGNLHSIILSKEKWASPLDEAGEINITSVYLENIGNRTKYDDLVSNKKYSEAIAFYTEKYLKNNNLRHIYNISDLFSNKSWKFYKEINSHLNTSIALDSYLDLVNDDKQLFNLKASWISFLKEKQMQKPSHLNLSNFDGSLEKYSYFLKRISVNKILEHDARSYKSTRDLIIERIAICETLSKLNNDDSLLNEKESLERNLAIIDGLNEVDTVGISVDEERFFKVAKNDLSSLFERYKNFLNLEKNKCDKKTDAVDDVIILYQKPMDESDSILLELIRELSDIFLKNHEFGIDYYLSMRIRHGRFMGICRGPLEKRRLITKYSELQKKYQDNEYWLKKFNFYPPEENKGKLNAILNDFSKEFDKEITNFIQNDIQVLSSDKPFGAFKIDITIPIMALLRDSAFTSTTMDDFLESILEYFMFYIQKSSDEIINRLNGSFLSSINSRLYTLQRDIVSHFPNCTNQGNLIVEEIIAARTEMNRVVHDICSWFDISSGNKQSIRTYSVEEIIEISVARTKRIYQSFNPEIILKNDVKNTFHSNLLAMMVDALTILLSNVYEHGDPNDRKVSIFIEKSTSPIRSNKFSFMLTVDNAVPENQTESQKLEFIRQEILNENIKSRQEGGSGFHKLLAMPIVSSSSDLVFGQDGKRFIVKITFSLVQF